MDEKNDEIAVNSWREVRVPILLALLLGLACAFLLPAYSGPDENGHVAYVSALAQGHLPIIPQGEIADIARGISWQGQHPPLFYALGAPLYFLTGQNTIAGLYILRALNVLLLLFVVWLVYHVARQLMSPRAARGAAFIVALHPTLVYTSSMVNNELLAVVFSLLCIHSALRWRDENNGDENKSGEKQKPILLRVLVFAGLALLTKLTAIAGVLAAAYIVFATKTQKSARLSALILIVGSIFLWLPWALIMKSTNGVWVPSPVNRPLLEAGLWSLTLSTNGWVLAFLTMCEMSTGLLVPYWLIAPYQITYYPMLFIGLVLSLWAITMGKRQPRFGFCAAAWCTLWLLLVAQVWFRDSRTSLFAARYTPVLVALFALPAAEFWGRQRAGIQRFLTIFASLVALATFYYIFRFFLDTGSTGTIWKNW